MVQNVEDAARRFEQLFGLEENEGRVPLGNNCEFHIVLFWPLSGYLAEKPAKQQNHRHNATLYQID